MTLSIEDADAYINAYVIDNEDWVEADESKKQRILNVANRTLSTEYPGYTIPDEAVYDYSSTLAVVFNDTNRLQQQGVASFSVTGVASFTFKESTVDVVGGQPLSTFITKHVRDLISAANPDKPRLGGLAIRKTVM